MLLYSISSKPLLITTNIKTHFDCGENVVSNVNFNPFTNASSAVNSLPMVLLVFHFSVRVTPEKHKIYK